MTSVWPRIFAALGLLTVITEAAHTPPGLPVLGNATKPGADPLRFLVGVQQTYGGQYPLVQLDPPVGQRIHIVLDAGLVHEILEDRERFARPALGPQATRRQGLLSTEGALWETQRSVLEPEFLGATLADYANISGAVTEATMANWPAQGTVDLLEEMSVLTLRVITRGLFSRDTSPETGRAVHAAMETFGRELEFDIGEFLLPETLQSGLSEEFLAADELVEGVAEEFIDWHRSQADPPADMLTALIEAQQDPSIELSANELVDETVLFLTAGQETTALTIAYAFYWLTQHPRARERVRTEASRVLGGDQPGWSDLSELTYTEQVIRETLRLTPAAWNISREPRAPTRVGGAELAPGELVMLSPYAHHRDRRVWDNPTTFDPDRWAGVASRGQDAYFPFGSGPRICIGRQVALTEAQFVVAGILQSYDVEVLAEELPFRPAVTLQPATTLQARVTARD
ncbi:cytochrome P450 [Halosegnis sp.]|uniref:cytochrome P450 n=1 Tax=Halosegnis sp. TaxID=2864959 RepID=UPI0035D40101